MIGYLLSRIEACGNFEKEITKCGLLSREPSGGDEPCGLYDRSEHADLYLAIYKTIAGEN